MLAAALAATYVVLTLMAYRWTVGDGGLAILWICNGELAAALLLLQRRLAIPVAAVCAAADLLCARWLGGSPWPRAGFIAAMDLTEAVLAASLIRSVGGAAIDLTRFRRFADMTVWAVLPATLLVGTAGAAVAHWVEGESFKSMWVSWAGGDFLGMMIGAPATLLVSRFRRFDTTTGREHLGSLALLALIAATTVASFWISEPPLIFTVIPVILLCSFRLSPPYTALAVVIVSMLAASETIAGRGPFSAVQLGAERHILVLQFFLACVAFSTLLAQCLLSERNRSRLSANRALQSARQARLRAEAAMGELAASEARFRMVADHASDVIARCTIDGTVTYLSPSAKTLYGYEPEELIGGSAFRVFLPDDIEPIRARLAALIRSGASGQQARAEYRVLTKSGEVRWVEAAPFLVKDPVTGRIVEMQDISRDITHRKLMEEELERRRAEAEAATVAKSQFLANMSHEIRTPLTGVIGFAGLLAEMKDLPREARRLSDRIVTSGEALLSVVNDVLDFSKLEAHQVELDLQPFGPAAFVAETVDLVRSQAQAKALQLSIQGVDDLPPRVLADSARLRQVLLNLLTNAIKFTRKGGIVVTAAYRADTERLRLTVIDSGVGIEPEAAGRLFQRFSQADASSTREFGGSGLGLAISKALMELMGGEIGMESVPGRGSTFWFTVPAPIAADQPKGEARAAPSAGPPAGLRAGHARLLLVDDVAMNRELVSAMLEPFDLTIVEAASGAEAVQAAMAQRFDLILMDLQMPGMDGLAATAAIRANCELNRRTPILALSANVLPEQVNACLAAGMNDHIGKPIQVAELLQKIAAWTATAAA